jgi:murein DD-endopeptidase MepM/ murein hydrolase activator NlpD
MIYKPCKEEVCVTDGTFLLLRPVVPPGRIAVDPSWRFGEIRRQGQRLNNGSEFLNSSGAPIMAAADGTVIYAGDDSKRAFSKQLNEYGNLIVIEHTLPGVDKKVYTLYGHLSEISVAEGDTVNAGQPIGKVGMTGNTGGSTLHFEVRLGKNSFENVRNPELWIQPLPDDEGRPTGALAGRVVNSSDEPMSLRNVVIEQLGEGGTGVVRTLYLRPYMDLRLADKSPWMETFAMSELPPGEYQLSIWKSNDILQKRITIEPGKLTMVEFLIP